MSQLALFLDQHNGALSAVATITIAAFTLVLVFVTNRQAKLTAASVRIAERSLSAERPWMVLEGVNVKRRDATSPNNWLINLKWTNVGRSPAIIEKCAFEVVSKNLATASPDYNRCTNDVGCRRTVPVGVGFFTADIGLDPTFFKAIEYVVYGLLIYMDLAGIERKSGFAVEISTFDEKFTSYGGDEYNYYI